jgi:predicted Zn-dependent peptidase
MAKHILFGKRSSPITYLLEEQTQLVNYIMAFADHSPHTNTASLEIWIETMETEKIEYILSLYTDKLREMTRPRKITQKMIDDVNRRLDAQKHLTTSTIEDEATNIGFSMINFNTPDIGDIILSELKKVKPSDVQRVINEYFLGPQFRFFGVPRGSAEFFRQSKASEINTDDISRIVVNDRITLLHKYSNEKPTVRVQIFIPSAPSYETVENVGIIEFMADLLFSGSKKYNSLSLSDWLEERNINLYTSTDRYGINIVFSCMKHDLDNLTDRILDALTNPSFNQNNIDMLKTRYHSWFNRRLSHPSQLHNDFVRSQINDNGRDQATMMDRLRVMIGFNRENIRAAYKQFITAEKLHFSIVGDIDENTARRWTQTIANRIPNKPVSGISDPASISIKNEVYENIYSFEQVNILFSLAAPKTEDFDDYVIMRVIQSLLNGSRGRLYRATRGENDLAYYTFASYIRSRGNVQIDTQTSIDKLDELIVVISAEIEKLRTIETTQAEINEAVLQSYKTFFTVFDEDMHISRALNDEIHGLGFDFDHRLLELATEITPADVMRVAEKYFSQGMDVFVSRPLRAGEE